MCRGRWRCDGWYLDFHSTDVTCGALRSSDARVRANALEGLDRLKARDEVFLRFTGDPHNRVRANAALALIERDRPEGRETLRQMLTGG